MSGQRKELGQHWLKDRYSLEAMAEAAGVVKDDNILEIGPGTGYLTDVLLTKKAKVTALEYDHTLAQKLTKKFTGNQSVKIVEGDIRQFDFSNIKHPYKIVANIPYYLSANLFRKLIDENNKPEVASLLVQKEVAERIIAKPGKLSALAVMVQVYYETNTSIVVPAHLFEPPPKVDSQILVLTLRYQPLINDADKDKLFRLVKNGFSQPRKKLISNIGNSEKNILAFQKLGLSTNTRAQELSIEQWGGLIGLI